VRCVKPRRRQGFAVLYTRFSRLLEELRIAHGDGSFSRSLQQLARTDLLTLDDWSLAPIGQSERKRPGNTGLTRSFSAAWSGEARY
jgi:hypothetical protein